MIVDEELKDTENIRNEIKLDQCIIMPNHLHGIIIIQRKLMGGQPAAPTDNIYGKQTLRNVRRVEAGIQKDSDSV